MLSEKRNGRITASAVGAVLRLSPFRTAEDELRAMVRRYHGAPSEFEGNPATEYGNRMEPIAAGEYVFESTLPVDLDQKFVIHPDIDWLGATPDGLVGDDGLLEIKCPYSLRNGGEFKTIIEQPHYYAQIQVQLFCTGRKWCDFLQRDGLGGRKVERVEFDQSYIDAIMPILVAFYGRYLTEREMPIAAAHLGPKKVEIDTPHAAKLIAEYDELADAIDQASQRRKAILDELITLAGNNPATICGRALFPVERKGSISYAEIVKKHLPDLDLEPYRGKPSSSWQLR